MKQESVLSVDLTRSNLNSELRKVVGMYTTRIASLPYDTGKAKGILRKLKYRGYDADLLHRLKEQIISNRGVYADLGLFFVNERGFAISDLIESKELFISTLRHAGFGVDEVVNLSKATGRVLVKLKVKDLVNAISLYFIWQDLGGYKQSELFRGADGYGNLLNYREVKKRLAKEDRDCYHLAKMMRISECTQLVPSVRGGRVMLDLWGRDLGYSNVSYNEVVTTSVAGLLSYYLSEFTDGVNLKGYHILDINEREIQLLVKRQNVGVLGEYDRFTAIMPVVNKLIEVDIPIEIKEVK